MILRAKKKKKKADIKIKVFKISEVLFMQYHIKKKKKKKKRKKKKKQEGNYLCEIVWNSSRIKIILF